MYSVDLDQWEPPLEDNLQTSFCKEFESNLSTGIWNSTALFCRDPVKAEQRLCLACELAGKVDVLVIVEAHGQEGSEATIRERLRKSHHIAFSPGPSQATGGVVVCVKERILKICGQPTFKVLDAGRIVSMRFTSMDEQLGLVGVHIDPHYSLQQKKHMIRNISNEMQSARDILWVVCGDFNFEALGERAYNTDRCGFVESFTSEQLALVWNAALGDLVEHHQSDFTRAQNGPHGATICRIDRIYSNIPAWRMLNLEVRTSTVGHVSDKQRLSDHVPVLSFICAKKQYGQGSIPVWVTRDPFYAKALDHEIGQNKLETLSPAEGLQQLKRCMRSACKQVTRKALRRGAVTIEEQIYWSLVCARALFHGLAWRVVQAILAYPKLEEFILVNCVSGTMQISDSDGLNQHISSLMRESIERLRSDIEETIGLPEYEREQQRTSLSRVMEWWSTRCRKISLQTARDEKGDVITDPDHAAAVFTAYWKRVAEEKTIDSKKAKEFLKQHVRKLPKFTCVLKLDEFVEIVREFPDSARGLDGVPYSAWKHASKDALKVLYRVYCSLFTEAQDAEDFNHSWLVLLAKGGHAEDDHIVARAAEDTRPVSLANSDSKICEIALNKPLANAMKQWACPE